MASVGVATLDWSFKSAPAGRTPGTTIRNLGPQARRMACASAAERVDIDQADLGEVRGGGDGAGHGIGNIVKFEIEEDFEAQAREFFDRSRAFRCEELQSDLEKARRTAKATRQGAGRTQAVNVQG